MSFQIQACIAAALLACAGFAMAEPEPVVAQDSCGAGVHQVSFQQAGLTASPCAKKFFAQAVKKISWH